MKRPAPSRRTRRPAARWASVCLAVVVTTAVLPGAPISAAPISAGPAAGEKSQSWQVAESQLRPAEESQLRQEVAARLVNQHGQRALATYGRAATDSVATMVEPKRYAANRNWVFGGGVIRVPSDVEAAPVALLFLAQRLGGSWQVALEGSPEFAVAARQAPVLSQAERDLFGRTSAAAAGTATGLALPWKLNQGWAHWGVHGDSGESYPYNSIDFYGGDGDVRASRAGYLYRFCTNARWPYVKVVHDNGYTTGYYHISNQTTKGEGAYVSAGEYLGRIDVQLPCGGRANGDHVHWTLWRGSTAVTVVDKTIGGWTWYSGNAAYQGYAERNGQKVYRNYCCPIVNYGPGDSSYPTGVVETGTFSNINVRSGPGANYSVVGSVNDGDVIEIACTATGDYVTGPWNNRTNLWNRMPSGGYLSDAFVDTGTDDPVAGTCS
ncbi:peptidoglycan DD-metalloendopeptidase family protein [Micromonospora sp. NBC_01405]|uniref:peptidoglycan DD-metalloendopeptidase family protein n=1 Tax=Micromonospora sp. NBC_01405 TaxID=2903589 RepID=UPI003250EBA7